jgi:predicted metal-dependent hydrolase
MTTAMTPATHLRRSGHISRAGFKDHARAWAGRIGVQPRRLQLQAMRRKWASCSTAGTVTFSVDLLRETSEFQEVVIVHELLHLLVPNHGPVFRSLMKAYLPNWERIASGRVSRSCGFAQRPNEAA